MHRVTLVYYKSVLWISGRAPEFSSRAKTREKQKDSKKLAVRARSAAPERSKLALRVLLGLGEALEMVARPRL